MPVLQLRFSNVIDWDYRFKAACGGDIKKHAEIAFSKHNAFFASEIMEFSRFFNDAKRGYENWYKEKQLANHPDIFKLENQMKDWIGNARKGYQYGKLQLSPRLRAESLELHLAPVIGRQFINITPEHAKTHFGAPQPPIVKNDMSIISVKSIETFDDLYEKAANAHRAEEEIASIGKWCGSSPKSKLMVVDNDIQNEKKPKLHP